MFLEPAMAAGKHETWKRRLIWPERNYVIRRRREGIFILLSKNGQVLEYGRKPLDELSENLYSRKY
jgi:hypothetical protein